MSATTIKFSLQLSIFSCQNINLHQHIDFSSHISVIDNKKGVNGFSHQGIFSLAEMISRPHFLLTLYLNQAHSFKHIQYCIFQLLVVLIFTVVIFKHTICLSIHSFIVREVLITLSFFSFTIYPSWDLLVLYLEKS